MASKQELEQIIDATDIVSLVSEYVKLERQGKNYKGLCPFHNEDTPSFVVNQEKKIAHCFGCGGGGDPIKFLMQVENIEFKDAVNKLAQKAGIKLSGFVASSKPNPLTKYYQIMQAAQAFYKKYLDNTEYGQEAINYLHKRGLDDETIKMFGVGLAPKEHNLLYQVLKESNYLELDMADVALVDKNNKGYYDLFTSRIMFPICNEAGNVVGFSGRIFDNPDKNQPKYVNSRETMIFKKKDILFNLHLAKGEILKKKRVILHEGQMDVIASYRSGFKEAVCTMGTALSIEQANILRKYTNHAVICYDGDKAGINASLKAIKVFQNAGFIVHLVLLPNGSDPDEFVLKNGIEKYKEYFESNMIDSNTYIFEQAILNKDFKDDTVVDSVKSEIFDMIYSSNSKTVEEGFLDKLSKILGTSYQAVHNDYQAYCNIHSRKNVVDFFPEPDFNYTEPKVVEVNKEKWYSRNEIRLFMYAKESKERAQYIESLIKDKMDALSSESQKLWFSLMDSYYVQYDEFVESEFLKLLDAESLAYYASISEILRKEKISYTNSDLLDCVGKFETSKYTRQNEKLNIEYNNTHSEDNKLKIINQKFKNKKIKEQIEKNRRK